MKALLIVIFAVYVTTVVAKEVIRIELPQSAKDEPKIAFYDNDDFDDVVVGEKETLPLELCSEVTKGVFSFYDYSVVIAMLAVSLKIGLFYGFFHKSSSASSPDSILSSKMSLFPVTLSLTTSFVTAIELLGNPAEMFFHGTQFSLIVISMLLVIPLAVKVFYPIYHEMQLTSCYEYLGVRFGKEMRLMGAILYIIQMCFYTSVSVLAPAIALSKATGLNTRLAIVLIYVVCVFYSSQGGLKAVIIADTFQACVLFISMIMIVCLGTYYQSGGIEQVFKIAENNDRLEFWNLDTNPQTRHSVFSVVIGGFFYWTSLLCVNQATVQKAMSLKSLSNAKIALTVSVFGLVTVFLVNFYTGLMAFAHYEKCDPLKSGQIDAIDQLMPFYVMDVFGHITFFVGIFVAGIFAASLGTVAACLSSLSSVTIEDLLIAGFHMKITQQQGTLYAKWMSVGYGMFSFGLIFLVEGRGILQATLTLNGMVGGILLGLFSLGIFFKRANIKGAFYGGLLAMICVTVLGVTAQMKNTDQPFLDSSTSDCDCAVNVTVSMESDVNEYSHVLKDEADTDDGGGGLWRMIYQVSYMYYSLIGTGLTVLFGLFFSMMSDMFTRNQILKIKSSHDVHEGFFRSPAQFSVASFTFATGRKLSTFIHHVAHDVSQSTLRVENRLKEVISHTNLHHLHHGLHGDAEDRISILNEENEDTPCGRAMHIKDSAAGKMFFIGHNEDAEYEESLLGSDDSDTHRHLK